MKPEKSYNKALDWISGNHRSPSSYEVWSTLADADRVARESERIFKMVSEFDLAPVIRTS